MPELPKHSVSVVGVVIDEHDRVLVIRRADNGHGEAPGGVLGLEEAFENGVRREVAEETGLTVSVDELSGVYKNTERGIVALVFRCSRLTENPHTAPEKVETRWMTRDEVPARMGPPSAFAFSTPSIPAPSTMRTMAHPRRVEKFHEGLHSNAA